MREHPSRPLRPPRHYVVPSSTGVDGGKGDVRVHDPPSLAFAPAGQVSLTSGFTSANEEAIILRYVSNGRTGCTVTGEDLAST